MSEGAVAERYARAIFALGEELGKLTQLSDDVRQFSSAYAQSKELRTVLADPVIPEERKTSVIRALGSQLAMCTEAVNTIRLIAKRRRLTALTAIARRLGSLTDEKSGVVRVKVTSAQPLSDSYVQRLVSKIEGSTSRRVMLEKTEDSSLIAGVITQIGGDTIDGSLRGRLLELERQLLTAS